MKRWVLLMFGLVMRTSVFGQTMDDFKYWPEGEILISTYDSTSAVIFSGKAADFSRNDVYELYLGNSENDSLVKWIRPLQFNKIYCPEFVRSLTFVRILQSNGIEFSEDTFEKPVQIGLCKFTSFRIAKSKFKEAVVLDKSDVARFSMSSDSISAFGIIGANIRNLIFENDSIGTMAIISSGNYTSEFGDATLKSNIDSLFSIQSVYKDTLLIQTGNKATIISFTDDKMGDVQIDSTTISKLFFTNCTISTLSLHQCYITDSFSLAGSHLKKGSVVAGCLTGPLNLQGLEIGANAELDLRGLYWPSANGKDLHRIPVNLFGVPIDKLHLDWSRVRADWNADSSPETVRKTYQALLNNFKARGQDEDYKIADIEAQQFANQHIFQAWHLRWLGYAWDDLVWGWWYYGYHRWQPAIWTLLLPFFIALVLRYKSVCKMQSDVYEVDNFGELEKQTDKPNAWQCYTRKLVYASVVFFALSVKFEKLHYTNGRLLARFILIYLLGIWCLFFIVNFLLKA